MSDNTSEENNSKTSNNEEIKIYPRLQSGEWNGLAAGALAQTLLGEKQSPEVVISFGYPSGNNFVFLTNKDLETKSHEDILEEAYVNLNSEDAGFRYAESLDEKVITTNGMPFCCEKILSKEHMKKAHEMLNAEELLVSVARRSCLMITAKNNDKTNIQKFLQIHKYIWSDSSFNNEPLTDTLFVLKDGEIIGTIPMN